MSTLVLRHKSFEHLGYFAASLPTPFRYHDLGDEFDREPYDYLIVLGGPMSANDPEMFQELTLIAAALERGIPILGVCLGAQLIAKALGARVYPNRELEIGWAPVFFTEAARSDRVFSKIPSPATVFHLHGETFDLPRNAQLLAWSDKTPHQAYRYGSKVYGLQFHPEVTAEMIEDWCHQPDNCASVATLAEPIDPRAHDLSNLAHELLQHWISPTP